MSDLTISDIEKASWTLTEVDAEGNPAGSVANVTAVSADETLVSASVDPDGVTVWTSSVGPLAAGVAVTMEADGAPDDTGAATRLQTVKTIDVIASAPTGLGATANPAVPR